MTIHDDPEPSEVLGNVSDAVKRMRQNRGMSQEKLALKAGTSQPSISAIERGQRHPGVPLLVKLCRALDIQILVTRQGLTMVQEVMRYDPVDDDEQEDSDAE